MRRTSIQHRQLGFSLVVVVVIVVIIIIIVVVVHDVENLYFQ